MTEAIVTGGQWEALDGKVLNGVRKIELRIVRPNKERPERVAEIRVTNVSGETPLVFRVPIDPTDTIAPVVEGDGYYSVQWRE